MVQTIQVLNIYFYVDIIFPSNARIKYRLCITDFDAFVVKL